MGGWFLQVRVPPTSNGASAEFGAGGCGRQMGLSPEPAAALAGPEPLTTSWMTPWTPH